METDLITPLKWMLCTVILHGSVFGEHSVQIEVATPVGKILGLEETVRLNSKTSYTVRTFLGIPYAESPTGNLRFRKPVPKANFNSPFDATKESLVCYQKEREKPSRYTRSEDCLRLNIYVPMTTDNELKPVMVWIHGGGFVNGESYGYNASLLSAFGDVIVVAVNYRLAFLGFFTTGDSTSSGNYGLWDQQLAIKWTSKNIQSFGGDPNRITLFGGSAGASSVLYQAFYPGNKGLFARVIAQSGTMLSPWAFRQTSLNARMSQNFAVAAGCDGLDPYYYTACLRALPIEVLNKTTNEATLNAMFEERTPGPVVDYEFIPDTPANLITGESNATDALAMFHSVDLMIGYNSADGMMDFFSWMVVTDCQNNNPYNFKLPENVFTWEMIPHYLSRYFRENIPDVAVVVTTDEYTDWADILSEQKRIMKLIALVTDYYVGVSTVQTAVRHIEDNMAQTSTFAYEFAVRPYAAVFPLPPMIDGPEVMKHGDEINYVFGMGIQNVADKPELTTQYNTYLATMTAWTNFAKTGNPNKPTDVAEYRNTDTKWPAFTTDWDYLRITPTMSQYSAKKRMEYRAVGLWTKVLPPVISLFNDDKF